eukprot:UC1_evm2s635
MGVGGSSGRKETCHARQAAGKGGGDKLLKSTSYCTSDLFSITYTASLGPLVASAEATTAAAAAAAAAGEEAVATMLDDSCTRATLQKIIGKQKTRGVVSDARLQRYRDCCTGRHIVDQTMRTILSRRVSIRGTSASSETGSTTTLGSKKSAAEEEEAGAGGRGGGGERTRIGKASSEEGKEEEDDGLPEIKSGVVRDVPPLPANETTSDSWFDVTDVQDYLGRQEGDEEEREEKEEEKEVKEKGGARRRRGGGHGGGGTKTALATASSNDDMLQPREAQRRRARHEALVFANEDLAARGLLMCVAPSTATCMVVDSDEVLYRVSPRGLGFLHAPPKRESSSTKDDNTHTDGSAAVMAAGGNSAGTGNDNSTAWLAVDDGSNGTVGVSGTYVSDVGADAAGSVVGGVASASATAAAAAALSSSPPVDRSQPVARGRKKSGGAKALLAKFGKLRTRTTSTSRDRSNSISSGGRDGGDGGGGGGGGGDDRTAAVDNTPTEENDTLLSSVGSTVNDVPHETIITSKEAAKMKRARRLSVDGRF